MKEKEAQLENLKDDALEEYTRLVHDLETGMTRKIDPVIFVKKTIGDFVITTGFEWAKIKDMINEERISNTWCYLDGLNTEGQYEFGLGPQRGTLRLMNLTEQEANSYRRYCALTPPRIR